MTALVYSWHLLVIGPLAAGLWFLAVYFLRDVRREIGGRGGEDEHWTKDKYLGKARRRKRRR